MYRKCLFVVTFPDVVYITFPQMSSIYPQINRGDDWLCITFHLSADRLLTSLPGCGKL